MGFRILVPTPRRAGVRVKEFMIFGLRLGIESFKFEVYYARSRMSDLRLGSWEERLRVAFQGGWGLRLRVSLFFVFFRLHWLPERV